MTLKVKLSALAIPAEEFARRVVTHCERLNEYYRHLDGVRADEKNPDLKPDERRIAFPAPSADDLINRALRIDVHDDLSFTASVDYEFEGPALDEKKAALFAHVKQMESAALQEAVPPAKARHWQFREADIREEDHMRIANHPTPVADPEAFLRDCRPADDTAFLAQCDKRRHAQQAVMRWAAKCEHDIDDLTETDVDSFVIAPFNG